MTPPKPFEPRPEAPPLPPLVRAAWGLTIGIFEFGSVVRRTEPHVRYLLLDSVRGSCLSSSLVWLLGFSMRVSCCESHQGQKARPSGPPGGAPLLVDRKGVRPRYAGPKGEFGVLFLKITSVIHGQLPTRISIPR